MVSDDVNILLAEYDSKTEELPDWAIKCLEKGYDSKSLRMLSSMSKWDSSSELDNYFRRSLSELGWNKIKKQDYLMRYAEVLARKIIENEAEPIETSRKIHQIYVELDYPVELREWHEIDEIIWDYEHFLKTGEKHYFFQPKEKLASEIKRVSEELLKSKN